MTEEGRRRLIAVMGFTPEDSLALLEDDPSFLGDFSESDSASSDDPSAPDSALELGSDIEENIDFRLNWPLLSLNHSLPAAPEKERNSRPTSA